MPTPERTSVSSGSSLPAITETWRCGNHCLISLQAEDPGKGSGPIYDGIEVSLMDGGL